MLIYVDIKIIYTALKQTHFIIKNKYVKILTNNLAWNHSVIHLKPVFHECYSKVTEIIYTCFSN